MIARRSRLLPDVIFLGLLVVLISLVVWQRVHFDIWVTRHDNLTAYLPWWSYLGDRLAAGEIPGWNPYRFSGAPFLADPQSGWMYFPTMLTFALFEPLVAIKVRLALQLLIGGFGLYALVRLFGYGPLAAFTGAALMVFGPLAYQTTYCCNVREQVTPWIPYALIGVELAITRTRWSSRALGIAIGGFAYSQMLAGWLGQGALDAALLIGAFSLYRALTYRSAGSLANIVRRVGTGIAVAGAVGLAGALLNAAALLPRLVVNPETTIGTGNYGNLTGYSVGHFNLRSLAETLVYDDFQHRDLTIPAAGIVLLLLALTLVPREQPVPFFAGMTVVILMLATNTQPFYGLFSLVPRWKELHDHFPPQGTAGLIIGLAMLAAAAIDTLARARPIRLVTLRILAVLGIILIAMAAIDHNRQSQRTDESLLLPIVFTVISTALILIAAHSRGALHLRYGLMVMVAILVFVEPMGLEILEARTGWHPVRAQQDAPRDQPDIDQAARDFASPTDPGGAGEYLQQRMKEDGPFRFVSYAGDGYPGENPKSYMRRRMEPGMFAILANSRSMFLRLYDMQGYNPVQLSRYTDFMTALNGEPQDYHLADLRWSGVNSPLLDTLNVRFILVHGKIPPDREDVVALTTDKPLVFENKYVRIYENPNALPHCWLVHDVRPVSRDGAPALLGQDDFNARSTALVEGGDPATQRPPRDAKERVRLTSYRPESLTIHVTAATDGLLVISDVYSAGWSAYVDGKPVDILPTDVALRGVPIPAGTHTVEVRYRPPLLEAGMAITLIAHVLLLAAVGWWIGSRRGRPATVGYPTWPSRA